MYKIDTDAEASVSAPTEASAPAESSPPPAEEKAASTPPPAPQAAAKASHRTPSIKFLGKEGWERRRTASQTPTVVYIPPNYGRPLISEDEMEALVMGGASMAPDVKKHSSGAMFG